MIWGLKLDLGFVFGGGGNVGVTKRGGMVVMGVAEVAFGGRKRGTVVFGGDRGNGGMMVVVGWYCLVVVGVEEVVGRGSGWLFVVERGRR
ncbi:unnamed protein product [Camellia sinensis]